MLALTLAAAPACSAPLAGDDDVAAAEEGLYSNGSYAVEARNSSNVTQLLPQGSHRANAGDLDQVGNDRTVQLRLPPASRVRFCNGEGGPNGTGWECDTFTNYYSTRTDWIGVPTYFRNKISFIEVTPVALAYRQVDLEGIWQPLDYGVHRANTGGLATVGNDQTHSIYVPPGMRVRACTGEGGTTGFGAGTCRTFDTSTQNAGLAGISFIEVQPVVSVFSSPNLTGTYSNHGAGGHLASAGGLAIVGNNNIESIIVPPGLSAVLSDHENLGLPGWKYTYERSELGLGGGANLASIVYVSSPGTSYAALTVRVSGAGSVLSSPSGIDCPSEQCSASLPDRSPVRLVANASGNLDVAWTGCTSSGGDVCTVDLFGARTVSARFFQPEIDDECVGDCLRDCDFPKPGDCIALCNDQCSFEP